MGGSLMRISSVSVLVVAIGMGAVSLGPAKAADRDAAVKQCVVDNKDEHQAPEAISSYCTCMAGKMPDTEKASVTEWEGAHKAEMDACAAGANWKAD